MILIHKERAENITSYIKDIAKLKEPHQQRYLAQIIKKAWLDLLVEEFKNNGIPSAKVMTLLEDDHG